MHSFQKSRSFQTVSPVVQSYSSLGLYITTLVVKYDCTAGVMHVRLACHPSPSGVHVRQSWQLLLLSPLSGLLRLSGIQKDAHLCICINEYLTVYDSVPIICLKESYRRFSSFVNITALPDLPGWLHLGICFGIFAHQPQL